MPVVFARQMCSRNTCRSPLAATLIGMMLICVAAVVRNLSLPSVASATHLMLLATLPSSRWACPALAAPADPSAPCPHANAVPACANVGGPCSAGPRLAGLWLLCITARQPGAAECLPSSLPAPHSPAGMAAPRHSGHLTPSGGHGRCGAVQPGSRHAGVAGPRMRARWHQLWRNSEALWGGADRGLCHEAGCVTGGLACLPAAPAMPRLTPQCHGVVPAWHPSSVASLLPAIPPAAASR